MTAALEPRALLSFSDVLALFESHKKMGKEYRVVCPAHPDNDPSLDVTEKDGWTVFNCRSNGCSTDAICRALGIAKYQLGPPTDFVPQRNVARASEPNRAGEWMPAEWKEIVATYDYVSLDGDLKYQVVRGVRHDGEKNFRQRRPDARGGWIWNLEGVDPLLFRFPELVEAVGLGKTVYVVEGEKDVLTLEQLGFPSTTNSGGAGKWIDKNSIHFKDARVVILPDNDDKGREHAAKVERSLTGIAASVQIVELPNLPPKGDVSDWVAAGGTRDELERIIARSDNPAKPQLSLVGDAEKQAAVSLDDFYAVMPAHSYLFVPSRELWPAASVNARIAPIADGGVVVKPAAWLDAHHPIEQLTWAPGEGMLIKGRLVAEGGWIERDGCTCFNLYRPPQVLTSGVAGLASPWLDHAKAVYPSAADHIIKWLAHRVQKPGQKINHALVLGGMQGIGKDTLLEPVKHAIGPWNFIEISPSHLLGRFTGFVKSVILRISEARDLGEMDRYSFYDHMKSYAAAPPDVLRCDEKNLREYSVFNVCGVIITTNHKTDGLYLPADDRRHFVAWSDASRHDFTPDYWNQLYDWYSKGGHQHVAAYLRTLDLSDFDPKAPPPQTPAFFDIVDANRAPEDAELADALDVLRRPSAVTLSMIAGVAPSTFAFWLQDRKNSRQIPHRLEAVGYVAVRNESATDGRWKLNDRRQVVYARHELSIRDRFAVVQKLVEDSRL